MTNRDTVEAAFPALVAATAQDRAFLLSAPVIGDALAGRVTHERYLAFLGQAWHHVRHTVPLLMAAGSRVPDRQAWLQQALLHYVEEEIGHDAWILDDIRAAGGDADAVTASTPHLATDALVACAWDFVLRRNPLGIFGMVYVLEGTSVALACRAADRIQQTLGLPDTAFTYLRSHGTLDETHIGDLAGILRRLPDEADRSAIVEAARLFFWLYGAMFRGLDAPPTGMAA